MKVQDRQITADLAHCRTGSVSVLPKRAFNKKGPYSDNCLPFEEFEKKYLKSSDIKCLLEADAELMTYLLYQRTGSISPELCLNTQGHRKLSDWLSRNFFDILKREDEGNNIAFSESEFLDFLHINKFVEDVKHDNPYGDVDSSHILLFFRKLLRIIEDEEDQKGYLSVAEGLKDAAREFSPGSIMFFLELFRQLFNQSKIVNESNQTARSVIAKLNKLSKVDFELVLNRPVVMVKPWDHQREAILKWSETGRTGIIEMATATGKTLVGILAIKELAEQQKQQNFLVVRVFCHSKIILSQWRREIIDKLGIQSNIHEGPLAPLLYYYNTSDNRKRNIYIWFDTIQTVYKSPDKIPCFDLLIVDEIHHSAAFQFRNALKVPCKWKLGLSATVDESDSGERTRILEKEFGPVVYSLSLKDAIDRRILPKFEWKIKVTELSIQEAEKFKEETRRIQAKLKELSFDAVNIRKIDNTKTQIESIYEFIRLMETARYRGIKLPVEWIDLQALILKRRMIINKSLPKLDKAVKLAKNLGREKKVILFVMNIDSCNLIAEELRKEGIRTFLVHSQVENPIAEVTKFRNAQNGVLVGARMLEEGIDIPDADVGINVSYSKTRLQLIQRMGRILRNKEDKKPVFYHFVARLEEYVIGESDSTIRNDLDSEPPLDDLVWSYRIAHSLNLKVTIDEEIETEDDLICQAKNFLPKTPRHESFIGTYRLGDVLNSIPDEVMEQLKKELKLCIDKGIKKISDVAWNDILHKSFHLDDRGIYFYSIDIHPGIWWLWLIANKDPSSISKLLNTE
ncbi:MAG: DEAD/DEAH box helicase family protein [Candidatus Thermoplasmatota archaeon]|nr:DEAD/DEAH box helicase family protein [Candidatus Thermoplasmatota archaeon]MCL5252950.1 DEAD/DEAH box helicase family protein [Candidatus Thermoplasmatota archaeon]